MNITNSAIHNNASDAAFTAAARGEPVGMAQIIVSIRTEYQKLDRRIYEAEC